jgi:Ran GTPase-activating protein 1
MTTPALSVPTPHASTPTSFSLKGQGLKLESRADIEPLLASVNPATLEEICLSGNTIGVEASAALAEVLAKAEKIRDVDFSDIFTGRLITEIPQALSALCDSLISAVHLTTINLSDNAFGGRSADPMVPLLSRNLSIQTLRLSNNGLGPAGGQAIAAALLASAKASKEQGKPSNLRVVICGRNRLENGSAGEWAEAFAEHGGLVEVRMPQNGIRMDGIVKLAKGLGKCPGMERIDMQDNCFSDEGSTEGNKTWAESLRQWTNLKELNLSDCVLSTDGEVPLIIEELSEGSNPKLEKISMQNDNLGVEAFEVVLKGVESGVMGSLKVLDLQDNDVDVEEEEIVGRLRSAMKARKGKFLASEEDEEEEDEAMDEEDEEKEEKPEAAPVVAPEAAPAVAPVAAVPEPTQPAAEVKEESKAVEPTKEEPNAAEPVKEETPAAKEETPAPANETSESVPKKKKSVGDKLAKLMSKVKIGSK